MLKPTGQFYFTINTPGDDSLCQPNGQVILDAGNFASFNWNTGETTQTIAPQANGNYWVLITDTNGCTSDTAYYNVTFFPSALDDLLIDKSKKLNS